MSQQALLGWVLVILGTALMLRTLCRRNDSRAQAGGWLSVGAGAALIGLWLVRIVDLPVTIADVFARL